MVLFKRKPVLLMSPPDNVSDHSEVYEMKGTGEIFTDYEKYLKRHDYLSQKKFTDAVNGKSGLTFFDAFESETKSSTAIENVFPDVLKDPILRRVQFSTISRIDDLVNNVYDELKRDFFPGEVVMATLEETSEQHEGTIREKAMFPMIRGPDGTVQREAFSRYFVVLHHSKAHEVLSDEQHIRRDKKMFTKQNLRSFLKNSLQREGWVGAPWLVKEYLALLYRLPMEIPANLLQDAKLLANRIGTSDGLDSACTDRQQQQLLGKQPKTGRPSKGPNDLPGQPQPMPDTPQQNPRNMSPNYQAQQQPKAPVVQRPPPPPAIKYPIEDLEVPMRRNGVTRPTLDFFTEEMLEYIKSYRRTTFDGIDMNSLGMLLEVWNTLNVQCEVYILDSFTFDDFVDAMQYSDPAPECELLNEVHCAVLKLLLDEQGKVSVKNGLPKLPDMTEEQENSEEHESEISTPQPDVPARSTRSRLSHVELASDIRHPTLDKSHRAAEVAGGEYGWKERLLARDMEDGGWQTILVGLLYQLSFSPAFKARCDTVLAALVPIDMEPNPQNIQAQYRTLHPNLRILALQMITVLSISSEPIRLFLEQCAEDMTEVRKRKVEYQRERKFAFEELQAKDRERKTAASSIMPESSSSTGELDDSTIDVNGTHSASEPDEDAAPTRGLRRGTDRKRKRDEDAARREKEKAEKAEAVKAQKKQWSEYSKLTTEIQKLRNKIEDCERKIVDCDEDLREANVQRTKLLGQDRFFNRYYWFERNGQPFGGLPSSSTASYGYANGRIWVQGPDDQEIGPYIDDKDFQYEYQQKFNATIRERRVAEEGKTMLQGPGEWGFYGDPDQLDTLIGWLDDRGNREKKLRKELLEWRDTIAKYMVRRRAFKDEEEAKKMETEDEQPTRITTRHQMAVDQVAARERCLMWKNTMALEHEGLGRLHSQNPPKKKERKGGRPSKGTAVLVNRQGKPLTRQGTSYK